MILCFFPYPTFFSCTLWLWLPKPDAGAGDLKLFIYLFTFIYLLARVIFDDSVDIWGFVKAFLSRLNLPTNPSSVFAGGLAIPWRGVELFFSTQFKKVLGQAAQMPR